MIILKKLKIEYLNLYIYITLINNVLTIISYKGYTNWYIILA